MRHGLPDQLPVDSQSLDTRTLTYPIIPLESALKCLLFRLSEPHETRSNEWSRDIGTPREKPEQDEGDNHCKETFDCFLVSVASIEEEQSEHT